MSANSTYMYMTAYKQRQNLCSSLYHKNCHIEKKNTSTYASRIPYHFPCVLINNRKQALNSSTAKKLQTC